MPAVYMFLDKFLLGKKKKKKSVFRDEKMGGGLSLWTK